MNISRLQNPADAPIGVFDSGIGGLSIVRELLKLLPDESLLYVGDQANCPYGNRPAEEIIAFSREISRYLIAQGAKVIVVACNTVSAVALSHLRSIFPETPFMGMVPAVKPAVQVTRSGVVGVLRRRQLFLGAYTKRWSVNALVVNGSSLSPARA